MSDSESAAMIGVAGDEVKTYGESLTREGSTYVKAVECIVNSSCNMCNMLADWVIDQISVCGA